MKRRSPAPSLAQTRARTRNWMIGQAVMIQKVTQTVYKKLPTAFYTGVKRDEIVNRLAVLADEAKQLEADLRALSAQHERN